VVHGTFSPARAWRPAAGARLARTLGVVNHRSVTLHIAAAALAAYAASATADDGSRFTSVGPFQLGGTTLPKLQRRLGAVPVVHTGDAGETLYTICYRSSNGAVLFMSGELDGPERDLGGIKLTSSVQRPPCHEWPAAKTPTIKSVGGLKLGMSRSKVKAQLAEAKEEGQGSLSRTFESRRRMTPLDIGRLPAAAQQMIKRGEIEPYFDVFVAVTVRFTADAASEIEVWKSVTW
jgi:hypothetical protein